MNRQENLSRPAIKALHVKLLMKSQFQVQEISVSVNKLEDKQVTRLKKKQVVKKRVQQILVMNPSGISCATNSEPTALSS